MVKYQMIDNGKVKIGPQGGPSFPVDRGPDPREPILGAQMSPS